MIVAIYSLELYTTKSKSQNFIQVVPLYSNKFKNRMPQFSSKNNSLSTENDSRKKVTEIKNK